MWRAPKPLHGQRLLQHARADSMHGSGSNLQTRESMLVDTSAITLGVGLCASACGVMLASAMSRTDRAITRGEPHHHNNGGDRGGGKRGNKAVMARGGALLRGHSSGHDWEADANAVLANGSAWETNTGAVGLERYRNEDEVVSVGRIRYVMDDESDDYMYIVSVSETFNEAGACPEHLWDTDARDKIYLPNSHLESVWYALRARLLHNLGISPRNDWVLEKEPRAHELGARDDQEDETLFTFHENVQEIRIAEARERVKPVLNTLDLGAVKRKAHAPGGYIYQKGVQEAIADGWITGGVAKRRME